MSKQLVPEEGISLITKNQSSQEIREGIIKVEDVISKMPGAVFGDNACPLKHSFGDGCYVREIFMKKGLIVVSKIHKEVHPYFILKGKVSVLTDQGIVKIQAPYQGMTPAGTKRLLYIHEDTVWITVHVTEETDLKKIEEKIIAKSFDDIQITNKEILELTKEE